MREVLVMLAGVLALAMAGCGATAPAGAASPVKPANPELILATTTSTQDSGLLDVLIPTFEKATGYQVKTIAVGTGQAMALGQRGEADVLLVHAPDSERKFVAEGYGVDRRLVMHNDFVFTGPRDDPAGIEGASSGAEALKRIARAEGVFISRGDNSGTHQLELQLWKETGIQPTGRSWYQETGQGMGATLNVAAEKGAYTLADRATYLALKGKLGLAVLVEGDKSLMNVYHVVQVNPTRFPKVNAEGAAAFVEFMTSKETQATIGGFGVNKYGQPLFFPDAGKPEQ